MGIEKWRERFGAPEDKTPEIVVPENIAESRLGVAKPKRRRRQTTPASVAEADTTKQGLATKDRLSKVEQKVTAIEQDKVEPAHDSPKASDNGAKCEVCTGLAEARETHRRYLSMPPDPKTGSLGWHRRWIDLYDKALKTSSCGRCPAPPTPPEDPDITEVVKAHIAIGPCMLKLTKKEQRRVNDIAKAYMAGEKLESGDLFDLADYIECLSIHASPDGAEELSELSQQLMAQGCSPIVIPPMVELAEPEEAVSDIRRIPLELIDVRTELYQYRRGGAEQPGLDMEHVQNIVDTFNPDRMTPIEVRQVDSRYELLSGHHRLEAFKLAQEMGGFPDYARYNVSSIPALIRQVDDDTARQLARLSNAQTKEYSPSEFAKIVELETNMGISPEAIAKTYGNRKVSEIEKFQDIALLPDSLLEILDNPTLRKTFTLDHAAVLGHAMREYDLAPAEAQMIFNRILKEGEYTAYQLERMLKTLGPSIKEAQVDMFTGMELGEGKGGIIEALRDVMDAIKAQETQRRRLRGFSNFIQAKRKAGEAVPEELDAAYSLVQDEIEATTDRIEELRTNIGQRLKTMPVKEAIKAPAPPPLPAQVTELAEDIAKRTEADKPWAILERSIGFGNLSYEDRDRVWGYKPLREVLAQVIGMGGEVEVYQAGFIGDQLQLTIREIPKEKESQITKAMKALDTARRVYSPYREMVFLVTLPPETVETEELLGKPQYIPETPVKGEKGEQAVMESMAPAPPPVSEIVESEDELIEEVEPRGALAAAAILPFTFLNGKAAWIVGILILAGIVIAIYYLTKSESGESSQAKEAVRSSGDPVRDFLDRY